MLFNEITILISWLEHPMRVFGLRTVKIKDYASISFNEDIFNYGNRKSDSIWVQIESLLAEKEGAHLRFATMDLPIAVCPSKTSEPKNQTKTLFTPRKKDTILVSLFVAEKEGFEPSLRLPRTTPLAGEPLEPLGYFSKKSS